MIVTLGRPWLKRHFERRWGLRVLDDHAQRPYLLGRLGALFFVRIGIEICDKSLAHRSDEISRVPFHRGPIAELQAIPMKQHRGS